MLEVPSDQNKGGRRMSLTDPFVQLKRIADALEMMVNGKESSETAPTAPAAQEKRGRGNNGRPKGLIPLCPRCRAPHRHSLKSRNNRCIDCEFEEEWDE